jgi:hypothetical protein
MEPKPLASAWLAFWRQAIKLRRELAERRNAAVTADAPTQPTQMKTPR